MCEKAVDSAVSYLYQKCDIIISDYNVQLTTESCNILVHDVNSEDETKIRSIIGEYVHDFLYEDEDNRVILEEDEAEEEILRSKYLTVMY